MLSPVPFYELVEPLLSEVVLRVRRRRNQPLSQLTDDADCPFDVVLLKTRLPLFFLFALVCIRHFQLLSSLARLRLFVRLFGRHTLVRPPGISPGGHSLESQ
jgi:hypothetical protein